MASEEYFMHNSAGAARGTGSGAFGAVGGIDLNEQLIRNKAETFFMRVNSDAMREAGIREGDVVIVDRSIEAASGKVVIASVNGELLIRRLEREGAHKARLVPASKLSPIAVDHFSESMIWGVVTYVIHHV